MSDATDDAVEKEEEFDMLRALHKMGKCDSGCPFCDPEFEPLFTFQHR